MEKFDESLRKGDYVAAITHGSALELEIHARIEEINPDLAANIYTLNLISFLIVGDLNGAKYLWKRAPSLIKSAPFRFADVWNIGKLLWTDDVPGALVALQTSWPDKFGGHLGILTSELRRQQLNVFAASYSAIPLAKLSASLAMTSAEATEVVSSLGWRIDSQQNIVYPVRKDDSLKNSEVTDMLQENLKLMEKITTYAAHFEKESIKVDLNSKNEPSKAVKV